MPLFTRFIYLPGGCLGFLPSTVRLCYGLINHCFPLIRHLFNPFFSAGGTLGGSRLTSHECMGEGEKSTCYVNHEIMILFLP